MFLKPKKLGVKMALLIAGAMTLSAVHEATASQLLGVQNYNAAGYLLGYSDGAGLLRTSNHLAIGGALRDATDALSQQMAHQYNQFGQLSVIKPMDASDVVGHVIEGTDAAKPVSYSYDADHRLSAVTQGDNRIAYTYYPGGSVKTIQYLRGGQVVYQITKTYDPLTGRLSSQVGQEGQQLNRVDYEYDHTSGVLQSIRLINHGKTTQINYKYDGNQRLVEVQRPEGLNTYYGYGPLGRLSVMQIGGQVLGDGLGQLTDHYAYNNAGNLRSVTVTNQDKHPGTATYEYTYNAANQLTKFVASGSSQLFPTTATGLPMAERDYGYQLNGGLAWVKTESVNASGHRYTDDMARYEYSPNYPDRLLRISHSNQALQNDADGQANNPSRSIYEYDKNGNMIATPRGGVLKYNALNQMVEYMSPAPSDPSKAVKITYGYNPYGLLASERSMLGEGTPCQQTANGCVVYNYYDGHHLVEQAQEKAGGQGLTYSHYLPGVVNVTSDGVQYLYHNQQGSVVATSRSTVIGHIYRYSPYGLMTDVLHASNEQRVSNISPSASRQVLSIADNHFGYTGQQQDPSSHLMMLGYYRGYNPLIAAFLKHDTLTAFSRLNTRNGFEYASDNPLMFVDPTGHFSWRVFSIGVGEFAAGFTLNAVTLGSASPIANMIMQQGVSSMATGAATTKNTTDAVKDDLNSQGYGSDISKGSWWSGTGQSMAPGYGAYYQGKHAVYNFKHGHGNGAMITAGVFQLMGATTNAATTLVAAYGLTAYFSDAVAGSEFSRGLNARSIQASQSINESSVVEGVNAKLQWLKRSEPITENPNPTRATAPVDEKTALLNQNPPAGAADGNVQATTAESSAGGDGAGGNEPDQAGSVNGNNSEVKQGLSREDEEFVENLFNDDPAPATTDPSPQPVADPVSTTDQTVPAEGAESGREGAATPDAVPPPQAPTNEEPVPPPPA